MFSRLFICLTVIAALIAAIIFLCLYIHSLLPAAVAIAVSYALSLIAALSLLTGESPSEFKCGWLTLIVALPVSGAVLYFLSYLSRTQKRGQSEILPVAACHGYEYFADGAEYLERLTLQISSAKKRVYLEYYIISKGHIWGAMRRELEKALARGVEIKIIYDALGSAPKAPKKDFKKLKKSGAQIKVFNKPLPLPVSRLNFRDHRKIAVIDGEAVFLGGVNIADEYANLISPHGF
ncbi:MAG: PLDc N-terminal domain-containing protein, partial [Clostridia bacterium]|nr:PLDc N-terminal domain-containing protein [Clostridia bacterium]